MVEGGGTATAWRVEVVVLRLGGVAAVVVVDDSVEGFVTTPGTVPSAAE